MSKMIVVAIIAAFCCAPLAGSVLYSNIGAGYPGDSPAGDSPGSYSYFGTTFTTTSGGALGEILLTISADSPGPYSIGLYTNSGGEPGTLLESYSVNAPFGNTVLTTINSLTHPSLSTGTEYWFVVGGASGLNWMANDESVAGGSWAGTSLAGLTQFAATDAALGIELESQGTVPEPGTGVLLVAGCLAVAGLRLRLRARNEH